MTHDSIKTAFSDAVNLVASNISLYTTDPNRDLIRNRKMGASKPISSCFLRFFQHQTGTSRFLRP